ncbi:MAG: hypothetical protein OXR62_02455 [Ahrensia sp.]|nr:hypothetical protein [Ahrensia sp.]
MIQPKLIFLALMAIGLAGCQKSSSPYNDVFTYSPNYVSKKSDGSYAPSRKQNSNGRTRYFMEFRARNALSYGHASVVLGTLDAKGRVPVNAKGVLIKGKTEVAGLHPRTRSTVPFSVGHVLPVPAETGWSDGDSEDAYVTARYTIKLNERQFKRVAAKVRKRKEESKVWHAITASCVTFIRGVANDVGLRTPKRPHLPTGFVNSLKRLNGKHPKI